MRRFAFLCRFFLFGAIRRVRLLTPPFFSRRFFSSVSESESTDTLLRLSCSNFSFFFGYLREQPSEIAELTTC